MTLSVSRCTAWLGSTIVVLLVLFAVASQGRPSALAQEGVKAPAAKEPADEKTIEALIQQLGDDSFAKREASSKRLTAIGEPALGLLEKAAQASADAEIRFSASEIIRAISRGLFVQVRQLGAHTGKSVPLASRVVVTPDGGRALSAGIDALRSWDIADGKQTVTFDARKGQVACWGLGISADGKRLIAGCHDKMVYIFDAQSGKKLKTLSSHSDAVWGVALSADGKQALSAGGDKTIRVWDVDAGQELRRFDGVVDDVRCLAWSPNGKLVATGHYAGDNEAAAVRLWDFDKGKEVHTLSGHKMPIACVAFAPDGKTLASTSFDTTVRLWDVSTGKELKCLEGHTNRVEYVAFTPDSKRALSCGNAQSPTLKLWDVASGKLILESEPVAGGFNGVAILPDGRQCVSVGRSGIVRLWHWKK